MGAEYSFFFFFFPRESFHILAFAALIPCFNYPHHQLDAQCGNSSQPCQFVNSWAHPQVCFFKSSGSGNRLESHHGCKSVIVIFESKMVGKQYPNGSAKDTVTLTV